MIILFYNTSFQLAYPRALLPFLDLKKAVMVAGPISEEMRVASKS